MTNVQSREFLIDMVVNKYFNGVDTYNLEQVLNCFSEDASITIRSGQPAQHDGLAEIKVMYEELFKHFPNKMLHRDFDHIVDEENESIASKFFIELLSENNDEVYQTNCNFFYIKNEKIVEMHVYMMGQNVLAGKNN